MKIRIEHYSVVLHFTVMCLKRTKQLMPQQSKTIYTHIEFVFLLIYFFLIVDSTIIPKRDDFIGDNTVSKVQAIKIYSQSTIHLVQATHVDTYHLENIFKHPWLNNRKKCNKQLNVKIDPKKGYQSRGFKRSNNSYCIRVRM